MELLNQLLQVHSPSGEEVEMKNFIINYVQENYSNWTEQPQIIQDESIGDALYLVFGKPRTAVFAHMDTIGFMVRYGNQLIPIGGPDVETGYELVGNDHLGPISCELEVDKEHNLFHNFPRAIDRGTSLTFQPNLVLTEDYIESPYLDNRLGLYNALKLCETLKDGLIAFSCYEEQGGGSVPMLLDHIMKYQSIKYTLVSDITWVTEGVTHGGGVAISMRDRNIPRKPFIDRIISLANDSQIKYQLEVEASGSSDGREIHHSPYAIDWCFIGAPEAGVHSPKEKVHRKDLEAMLAMYQFLMLNL